MERITTPELANKFIEEQVAAVREQVGGKRVLLALSGGVDSSVVAALLIRAIGKQLVCVHVNHGLMRKGESEQVIEVFRNQMDANLVYIDATDRFLDLLAGVSDPEKKRKIIGGEFIKVFDEEASKLEGIEFLAQGTIYPDILESHGVKAHHNVGGLPEDMKMELVEPVKLLFKDEVRVVGEALGLPHSMVYRQPFPGPGLGVRCLGAITRDRLNALREADAILREEFDKNGLAGKVWQYFIAVPDFKSVGVRDGKRYEGWPAIIRAVNTTDAMTATIEEIPYALLHHITDRITHEVEGINRVVMDLTPKPIGTIEWEYYTCKLLSSIGIFDRTKGNTICKLYHPTKSGSHSNPTGRTARNGYVSLTNKVKDFVVLLLNRYSYAQQPLKLDDPERMTLDVVKEIYSFYPPELMNEIGESDELSSLLELPKLIEEYSNNPDNDTAYLFEEVLDEGFSMFYNVQTKRIGGAGHTDIECLYLTKKKKFAVESKSTANKLSGINIGRLREHREEIGGEYTIVITPRYVPAAKRDIKGTPIVIILASTFAEYLYNHIFHDVRDVDYADFDDIIIEHLGEDVSKFISDMTMAKFAVNS